MRHIESIIRIAEAHAKVSVAVRFETAFCVVLRIESSVWCDPLRTGALEKHGD